MSTTNPTTTRYVGVDVHKRLIHACIVDGKGKVLGSLQFHATPESISVFAKKCLTHAVLVVLKATSNGWAVADAFRPYVKEVVVSNPLATRAITKSKVKSDKVNARVLAHLLRWGYLPTVWQPDAQTQKLRQLTRRRAALVRQRTQLRNRIHSLLAMSFVETPPDLFSRKGVAWLREFLKKGCLKDEAVFMIESPLRLLQSLQEEIDRFEDLLARQAYADQKVRLLMTLPGFDVTVALGFLAAVGDINRFQSPHEVASYLGLVPSTRQSADKCYHGPITKQGNGQGRWLVIQAAQQMGRNPGPLGHFFRRLKRRKNHNIAVVATARKLAMIATLMLKNNEPYRYAIPRSTETKLARLRVRATGRKRKGGGRKGTKCTAKIPGGSRTIKSLDEIYAREGLPAREKEPAPGELAMLKRTGTAKFAESLKSEKIVPRRSSKTKASQQRTANSRELPRL